MAQNVRPILFVDDDLPLRNIMGIIIPDMQFKIIMAANGEEGYKIFEEAQSEGGLSMILTDIRMEPVSGLEMVKRIKTNYPNIKTPIVALTGYKDRPVQEFLDAGFSEVLIKPIKQSEFERIFQEYIINVNFRRY